MKKDKYRQIALVISCDARGSGTATLAVKKMCEIVDRAKWCYYHSGTAVFGRIGVIVGADGYPNLPSLVEDSLRQAGLFDRVLIRPASQETLTQAVIAVVKDLEREGFDRVALVAHEASLLLRHSTMEEVAEVFTLGLRVVSSSAIALSGGVIGEQRNLFSVWSIPFLLEEAKILGDTFNLVPREKIPGYHAIA